MRAPGIVVALAALGVCRLGEAHDVAAMERSADAAINASVAKGEIPGAVLLVGHEGKIVYEKAYGERALVPRREAMTEDTIFDMASLTKVTATTPCLMKLFEEGKIRPDDRVTAYLPEFEHGHSDITLRDLMTHFSGLPPDLPLKPVWSGYQTGIQKALETMPDHPPGTHFTYSDINFILLGEIVRRVSGETLDEFAAETVYKPLGMKDTMFRPPASLKARIAPTEIDPDTGVPFRGVVHDETSRYMGGVAGHAGLFSTAGDMAKYAQMLLDEGAYRGGRIFSAATVRKFTSPETPANQPILRGFGFDIDSPFSSNRGDLFPIGSYGHTGFTGTDLWIDPKSRTYVILLTNSVHPQRGKPGVISLRARVATVVAAAYGYSGPGVELTGYNETLSGPGARRTVERNSPVETGLDVLGRDHFSVLAGRHIGLITNHTGLSRDGKRNIDLMRAAGVDIRAIFSPEHGIAGAEDQPNIGDSRDAATGIPVYSLFHGKTRRPTEEMLKGIDTLVYDIQDVGARFYTYSCTLVYSMEEAERRGIVFYVLDRPNPITGVHVEGPMLDEALASFVGCADVPVRHGMTLGELAGYVRGERHMKLDLRVVQATGWERGDWFDSTGLTWVDPSPNMRSLNAAILYPGLAILEATPGYSVGRGTDAPFEQVGAAWMNGEELAAYLNKRYIPGIRVYPARFKPASGPGAGEWLNGVRFVITDRDRFNSVDFGLELAAALRELYPGKMDWRADRFLIGNEATLDGLMGTKPVETLIEDTFGRLRDYIERRGKYLLYPAVTGR
jgi:uncharacterized protein YbbC (DUF1343 family)/CubicO group peptidase (beta-lactamase class C family)